MDLLLLRLDLLQKGLVVLVVAGLEGLELAHLHIPAIDEIGAKGLQSREDFLSFLLLVRVCVVHDAEITGALLVDVGLGAIAADGVGADPAMVLPEEIGEVSQADDTIGLLFIGLLGFLLDVLIDGRVPGMVRVTVFWPPPTMNDFVCGS